MSIIFRLHHDKDDSNRWRDKGKKLARWDRRQYADRSTATPVPG